MKVSLNWLKRYIPDLNASADELATVLPLLGLEVDAVESTGLPPLDKVVVGEVLSGEQHPNADRLSVCQVNVGTETLQIVCGASNYKVGDRIPVALVDAILPGDFKIKKSKLRGVESCGMMCSPRELGLGDDHKGIMILDQRPEIGTPINDVFSDGDTVFDLELTANRGDCLSHIGVARELAAWYNIKLKIHQSTLPITFSGNTDQNSLLKDVNIESPNCSLYIASYIKGVKIAPSPEWLQKDLLAIGLRPINNIVDITNWVMMETGQPLHAFDLAKIAGKKIIIRQAKPGESITTLDEKKRTLDDSMLVIADEQKPLVIAGVMGSLDAELDDSSVDIVLESAYFNPASIRKTSRKLDLSTDSSYRFIRDVDPKGVPGATRRAVAMILEIAGGDLITPSTARGIAPRASRSIEVTPEFIRQRCGFGPKDPVIIDIFHRLGFFVNSDTSPWHVTVPTFRSDIERPIDLVEEFLRIYGTDKIPSARATLTAVSRKNDPVAVFNHNAADYLVGQHFNECYIYSLRDAAEITKLFGESQTAACALENPLTSDYSHLRPSLIPGLLDTIKFNQNHGNPAERLFETGRTFQGHESQTWELLSVAFVIAVEPSDRHWLNRQAPDFFNAKNLALRIARIADIPTSTLDFHNTIDSPLWQNNQAAHAGNILQDGFSINVGLINLKLSKDRDIKGPLLAAEISLLPGFLDKELPKKRFRSFSPFPSSTKDIALVVDKDTPADSVRRTLSDIAQKTTSNAFNIENVSIFDVYEGRGLPEGKKSLALAITFRADDRTLTDQEVMNAFDQIQKSLKSNTDFSIRS